MNRSVRMILIGVGAFVLLLGLTFAFTYNSLVKKEVAIDEAYADVISRLNERQATVQQLLGVVSGMAAQEQAIINAITQARSDYNDAATENDLDGMITADNAYVSSITDLLVVVENYPDIASSQGFLDLMVTISGIESALLATRSDYIDAVGDYNKSIRLFPTVIIASMFPFEDSYEYWRLNEGAADIPEINFGTYAAE